MEDREAINLKKIKNFRENVLKFNKYLVDCEMDMLLIYDGNPYCHEYSLNCKLQSKSKQLINILDEYEKAFKELEDWTK